jgi:hypothetical protein
MECEVVECGVWSVECGVWSVKCGVWSVECGVWSVECGVWSVECGVWIPTEDQSAGHRDGAIGSVRSAVHCGGQCDAVQCSALCSQCNAV